jgi:hypothetical protein
MYIQAKYKVYNIYQTFIKIIFFYKQQGINHTFYFPYLDALRM